jgi:hypothetical protein
VAPSLAIAKPKQIAASLSIPEDDFKASWQWLRKFRTRTGLQEILLHGEGGKAVNSLLLPNEDVLVVRGKKKIKDHVSSVAAIKFHAH